MTYDNVVGGGGGGGGVDETHVYTVPYTVPLSLWHPVGSGFVVAKTEQAVS